jgi:hypothetical protein
MKSASNLSVNKILATARYWTKSISFALCLSAVFTQSAIANTPPKRILFTGNSFSYYNNGIHNHVASLVRSDGEWESGKNRFRLLTLSGSHVYEQLPIIEAMLKLNKQQWDAVVLQGHSNEAITSNKREKFEQSIEKAIDMLKEKSILPILFMTWEYEGETEMGKDLLKTYINVAAKHKVPLVPVGLAFAKSQQLYPDISLYSPDFLGVSNKDTSPKLTYRKVVKHPSQAGTYLTACVFYAALYNKSPQGLAYIADLPPKQAKELQNLAWQVVEDFKK